MWQTSEQFKWHNVKDWQRVQGCKVNLHGNVYIDDTKRIHSVFFENYLHYFKVQKTLKAWWAIDLKLPRDLKLGS